MNFLLGLIATARLGQPLLLASLSRRSSLLGRSLATVRLSRQSIAVGWYIPFFVAALPMEVVLDGVLSYLVVAMLMLAALVPCSLPLVVMVTVRG